MMNAIDVTEGPSSAPHHTRDWQRMAERVKRDHATMRALVDDVERACRSLEERRPESLERFRHAVWTLSVAFDDHIATEEASFLPLLRAVDQWGERRVVSLMTEHIEQRRVILELAQSADLVPNDPDALVVQARALVASFRIDMDSEDRSLDGKASAPPPALGQGG